MRILVEEMLAGEKTVKNTRPELDSTRFRRSRTSRDLIYFLALLQGGFDFESATSGLGGG